VNVGIGGATFVVAAGAGAGVEFLKLESKPLLRLGLELNEGTEPENELGVSRDFDPGKLSQAPTGLKLDLAASGNPPGELRVSPVVFQPEFSRERNSSM
jgi:hypothetical protein